MSTFAPAYSRQATLVYKVEGYRREHYILEMRRWRFVFGSSKLPLSK